jgi:hypothetical protein
LSQALKVVFFSEYDVIFIRSPISANILLSVAYLQDIKKFGESKVFAKIGDLTRIMIPSEKSYLYS